MKKSKDRAKTKDWKKADARILGQILAAQNIEFVLPDSTRIAEFFAETLTAIPGIAGCRVCFYEVSVLRGGMETGICQECEASRRKTETHEMISSFEPGFICKLAGQSGMQFNAIASPSHHFGFFIFQVNDLDAFNIYRPFIDNLANYVALSLENRQQRDLLQKTHDELEHKVAERTEELRASNDVIKDLYNNAPCGYHSLDKDGFIILINDTELRWLGYSRAEIIGKVAFRDLLTANSLKLFEKNFPTFKERGWVSDLEFELVCKNGDILPVLLNATAITDSDGNYVMSRSTIFDITERKRAEDALRQRELHSQSLLRLSRSLEHSQTYTEVLNAALDEVKAVIGYQNLWAYLLTEDRKYFKAFIAGGTWEEVVMSEDGTATLAISGDRMLEEIAEAREIVIVEDAPTDERTDKDIVASLGNHTIVNIPIIVFDKHLGTIGTGTFGDEGVRVPTKTEQEYLLALASHMAVALDRIHLLEKRKQMEQELVTREREYRVLVENIPDLIVRYNTELRRIYVNPAWEKASGSPARDVLNVIPADVPGGPRPANNEYVEKLQHVLKTGIPQTIEFTWINAYEKALLLECFIVPEYDQHGIINGVLSVGRDITERKRNERELITLNRAINQSSDAVFLINEQLTFAYVNDAACRSLGYTREELLTMGPSDIDATITYNAAKDIMSKQFAAGSFPRFETQHKTRDGRVFPVEVSSSVVEYDGAKFSLTTVHDITKRKQAENALKEREKHSQSLLRLSRKLERAQTYAEALSAAQDEVRDVVGYQNLWAYLFTPDKKQAKALFAKGPNSDIVMSEDGTATLAIQGDRMMEEIVETRDIVIVEDARTDERTDKKIVEKMKNRTLVNIPILLFDMHMGSIGVGTFGDEGVLIPTASQQEYLKTLASHMAVTLDRIHLLEERRQAEQSLRESEEKYRALAENIPNVVYQCKNDSRYTFIYLNDAIEKLTGYSKNDFIEKGLSFFDIYHSDDLKKMPKPQDNNAFGINRSPFHVTYRIRHKSGEWRWVDEWGTGVVNPIGKVEYLEGIMVDITERKLAEQTLRESEERYRQLVNLSPDAIGIHAQGTIVYANPAMLHIAGSRNAEDLIGKPVLDFIHLDFHEIIQKRINGELVDNVDTFVEEKFIKLDGSSVDVEVAAVPYEYQGQRYTQVIARDITQRKQHEREREAIISVSAALRQARTKTGILNIILDQLITLFEVDGAMLVMPNIQKGGLVNEMGRGIVGERMIGLVIPSGRGICDWVITNKTPYLNNHADQDPLFYRPDLLGDSRCVACAPLLAQEQSIGALWLTRRMDFAEQDIHLLTAIADIAANAIHRVMLHEQTELQLHHLTALHQIDIAISRNFDSNLTLNVILNNVKNELKSDAADILLLDPITHTLDFVAGIGFRARGIEQSHVKLADGYAGTAAREYRTVSCPDLKLARASFSRSSLLADEEFTTHFATPLIVKGQVKGVLELFHRKAFEPESGWIDYFETLATQAAIAIENASLLENLQRFNSELTLAYDATIEGWSRAMDLRDKETEGHTQRVTEMALELANMMGISEVEKQHLWRGSLLHDIGKMGVPDSILFKPGPLSEAEKQIMRQHPLYAYQMLSPITYLKPALDISYCHHERWDGSGYPRGLKGEEIPLSARLFAIVDVFDALTSDRPYRAAWPREDVYRHIQEQAGKHFDPQIVKIVLDHRMW